MGLDELLEAQKKYFEAGNTLSYSARKTSLLRLKEAILKHTGEIYQALQQDLGKSETESYMCEVGLVLSDLQYQLKHLKGNMKIKRKRTPLAQFRAKSYQKPSPYGNTLIISPWNYPILLSLEPLVGAIAAGNTVLLKPSEYSEASSMVLKNIIEQAFPASHVAVILGDSTVSSTLLEREFDYIFFTGGTKIGKIVYEAACRHLTPVTLELGGKSPVIVDESAKISLAAKRIVFGKFINCGQTCVAPDYAVVHESKKQEFIKALIYWIQRLYPKGLENQDYGKIIHDRHWHRLMNYMDKSKILYGGKGALGSLKIEPTLLEADLDDAVMQEEIFGPILPILSYRNTDELFFILSRHAHPLALYVFSENKKNIERITSRVSFGGGCINDTIIHLATNELPFGGIRESGIGSYHGKKSFESFSHMKSIVAKASWLDLPIRYTPYTRNKTKLIQWFMK